MGPQALGVDSLLAKSTRQAVCSLRGEAGWAWGWMAPMGPRRGRCKMGSECVLKGRTTAPARALAPQPFVHDSGPHRGSAGRAGDPLGGLRARQACQAPGDSEVGMCTVETSHEEGENHGPNCVWKVSQRAAASRPPGRCHPTSVQPGPRLLSDSLRGKGHCAALMGRESWWESGSRNVKATSLRERRRKYSDCHSKPCAQERGSDSTVA